MPLLSRTRHTHTTSRAAVALVAGSLLGQHAATDLRGARGGAQGGPGTPVVDGSLARSPELSETSRLNDRRTLVTGDRAWALGTADGRYPAAGFHTRGEMGGFWLPNLKLLDGMWFGIDDDWIGPAHQDHLRLGLRPRPTCPPPTASRPAAPTSCPTGRAARWSG